MELTALAAALTAGMLAAFNPCGFALLPGYLALFLGDSAQASRGRAISRSLAVSGALTAGFVVVFGIVGLIVTFAAWRITAYTPYLTLIVGPLLVLLGIWLLLGRELKLRLPRMKGTVSANPAGMFIYGMIYATVSLSCTLPIFLIAVAGSLRSDSVLGGASVILAYALGMGLVMTVLTLAVALARTSIVSTSRNLVKYINRVSGALLVLAGGFLTSYGYSEIQLLRGSEGATLPDSFVNSWLSELTTFIDRVGGATIALVVLALIAGLITALYLITRFRDKGQTTSADANCCAPSALTDSPTEETEVDA